MQSNLFPTTSFHKALSYIPDTNPNHHSDQPKNQYFYYPLKFPNLDIHQSSKHLPRIHRPQPNPTTIPTSSLASQPPQDPAFIVQQITAPRIHCPHGRTSNADQTLCADQKSLIPWNTAAMPH